MSTEERSICEGCGEEVDLETCHCGDPMDGYHDNHAPIPMGCVCGKALKEFNE